MKTGTISRAAWRPRVWGEEVGVCLATVKGLLASGQIESVKIGSARLITTAPEDFVARVAAQPKGSLPSIAAAVAAARAEGRSPTASPRHQAIADAQRRRREAAARDRERTAGRHVPQME